MNKIIKANIQGFVFPIDEQAYERLNAYFDRLKLAMPDAEAFEDIERRVAELFSYRLGQGLEAIFMAQVEAVIQQIGEAAEFMDAATPSVDAKTESVKRLYRNPNDKRISGVASGLAAYFGLDATLVRVFFAASIFVGGFGALLYLVLVLLVPEATTPAQQLEMRGEAVNVENLARTMKNGIQENLDKHGPRAKSWLQSRSKGLARVMGFVLLIAFLLIAVPLAFSVVASAGAFGFIYGMVQQYFFVS
ncbi:MAG: PspC domain-containing protein, partial [Bacteroidia bacterium]